ncbi:MAG TPA: hypothetical protein VHA82_13080 [Ramlibacter sp.]|uniref:hypothetical protein n=1 Tax=Ramlibacter sp. TaxID=1917967 RepID=UPI002BBCEBFE|nr:hypothetical protein [Ramlibacter sp.]HVZ44736.1 hypothetical protein [Ramlibacter sp.]
MLAAIQDNDLLDDLEAETTRQAYNAAFEQLGLGWHWDPVTYACLPRGAAGVRAYIEQHHPHLLRAYDAEFLANAVESTRLRCVADATARAPHGRLA